MNAVAHAGRRITVGIADARATAERSDEIITYALGSCLSVVLYDPVTHVTGMLHAMLPDIATSPHQAERNPAMFVESGVPFLLHLCVGLGADRRRLVVTVAGAACMTSSKTKQDFFHIGDRNVSTLQATLRKHGLFLKARDVGGNTPRTMRVRAEDGVVTITGPGGTRTL